MSKPNESHPLIQEAKRPTEVKFKHPLNPNSEMHGIPLGDAVGLQRIGVHLIRVPPGKESCIYHTHGREEEFIFIISGRGTAEIDGAEYEISSGDFLGFPTPSVGHHLRNDSDQDLIYIVGGERREFEFAEFPQIGKHIIRTGPRTAYLIDSDKLETLVGEEPDYHRQETPERSRADTENS